jgi:hypothetical protein
MVINIDLLDGATIEYQDLFYTVAVDENRLQVNELFTGLQLRDSKKEMNIIRAIIKDIEKQTNN